MDLQDIAEDIKDIAEGTDREDVTANDGSVTYPPRSPHNATSRDIAITRETNSGPLTLRGTLEMPTPAPADALPNDTASQADDVRPVPLLVMVHGIMTNRRMERFDALSDALLAGGIATLRFDMNGRGQSDGAFERMTIPREMRDLEQIFAFARELPGVDSARVALLGHSQGGLTSLLYAAEHPLDVAALVLTSPAVSIPRACSEREFGYPVGKKYLRTAAKLRPFAKAGAYEGPVCIFHGGDDPLVSDKDVERLFNAYSNADLHMLARTGHGLGERYGEVVDAIVRFLQTQFALPSHARPVSCDPDAPGFEEAPTAE
ncbi:MAG: alpha/beta fold hydrolase [Coriobacteriales bacterium]|jgi:pimeloyl-ACP methyl ester carboxylesterase